jgi:two-component system alkaline phosphatase synthesis response regulator PhoP
MKLPRILIIEDEPGMALGLRDNCEYEGYEVSVACDGEEGLRRALEERPDLILLDVMLPKLSGLDVCRRLRAGGSVVPVIMLTARGLEIDKVVGLELGADDYVTKPFGVNELLARIRAHLRRASRPAAEVDAYSFGDVELNFRTHEAAKAGRPVDLSAREFEILKYLIRRRGEPVTRDQLLEDVWGDRYPFSRTVDNHIAKLRQKIETDPTEPRFIVTLHRIGYKFLG